MQPLPLRQLLFLYLFAALLLVLVGCPSDEDDAADDDTSDDDTGDDDSAGDDDTAPGEWIAVDAGEDYTCGIHADGTIECWGLADSGVMDEPVGIYTQVGGGWDHATAIAEDGTVVSWGCFGESGIDACNAPQGEFVEVAAGYWHTCGLQTDGSVQCWGLDNHGQCAAPADKFVQIDVGNTYSCGVREDSSIVCWGTDADCVADTPEEGEFLQVSAVRGATCGLHTDGTIECWGCGVPDFDGICSPPDGAYASLGDGHWGHFCAIAADGHVDCWGEASDGQIGAPDGTFQQVSAGHHHTCGLTTAGDIECWGSDDYLQCSGGEYHSEQDQLEIPPESGATCQDTEPNDEVVTDPLPWKNAQECPDLVSAGGSTDVISGVLDTVVIGTWDGDTDAYYFTTHEDGYLTGSLDWDSVYHDLDWYLLCYYGDEYNKENWYVMIPEGFTASLSKPEEGQTVVPMTAGTECYAWVVGYDAPDSTPYELRLWMTYEDIQEE